MEQNKKLYQGMIFAVQTISLGGLLGDSTGQCGGYVLGHGTPVG